MLKTLGYLSFTEASAIDFIASKNGFEVFYQLLNLEKIKSENKNFCRRKRAFTKRGSCF